MLKFQIIKLAPCGQTIILLNICHSIIKNIKQFIDKNIIPRLQGRAHRKHKEWSENIQAIHQGEVIYAVENPNSTPNQAKRTPLTLNQLLRIVESQKNEEWLIMAPTRATCDKISQGLTALKIPHFCHRQDVINTDNRIHVQTIHTSKGMGSDNSALVSVSRGDRFLLDKDSRLLYVALTRAKKSLFMVNQ